MLNVLERQLTAAAAKEKDDLVRKRLALLMSTTHRLMLLQRGQTLVIPLLRVNINTASDVIDLDQRSWEMLRGLKLFRKATKLSDQKWSDMAALDPAEQLLAHRIDSELENCDDAMWSLRNYETIPLLQAKKVLEQFTASEKEAGKLQRDLSDAVSKLLRGNEATLFQDEQPMARA